MSRAPDVTGVAVMLPINSAETRKQGATMTTDLLVEQLGADLCGIADLAAGVKRLVADAQALGEDMPDTLVLIPLACGRIDTALCELGGRIEALAARAKGGAA